MGDRLSVAVVAESFLPHMNGVTNSVLRVLAHLRRGGHRATIFCPNMKGVPDEVEGFPVVAQPSVPMPGYPDVRYTLTPDFLLLPQLADAAPDVVHVASPLVLGNEATQAAQSLGVPAVAVYQTEVTSYAALYGFPQLEPLLWRRLRNLHNRSARTLAPSQFSIEQLASHGIERLYRWGRGVDTERFHPSKRSAAWRARIAPNGERIVGYVGRLAPEKQTDALAALADLPGTQLVVVGSGPAEPALRAALPRAHFLGHLSGEALAEAMAGLDVFVHTGEFETFCQTVQEAHASGVAVVAPRRGGPVDLVTDGVDGYLYTPGDPADLRARVTRLLETPEAVPRFGASGRAKVEHHTWDAVCDELVAHYRAAIGDYPALPR